MARVSVCVCVGHSAGSTHEVQSHHVHDMLPAVAAADTQGAGCSITFTRCYSRHQFYVALHVATVACSPCCPCGQQQCTNQIELNGHVTQTC